MARCKECKKEVRSGIWVESKFKDSRLLKFCTEKCKDEHLKSRMDRIEIEYPNYHKKVLSSFEKKKVKNPKENFMKHIEETVV